MSKRVTVDAVVKGQPVLVHKTDVSSDELSQTSKKERSLDQTSSQLLEGFPYSRMDRIFVSFGDETPRGYDGMEMGNGFHPVTFVKKVSLVDTNEGHRALQKTYHENLVNLTDISVARDAVYLTYERTGLSLKEIKAYGRVMFDRVAVATICREIIHGLIYIHDALNICHGELNCDNVHINEDGKVQIGDIGNSMIRQGNKDNISRDVQAIYDIASSLLDIETSLDKSSMSFYLADHFTKLPSNVRLQDLLKHPFLKIGQGCWYLANLGILYTFGVQRNSWFNHVGMIDSDSEHLL